MSGRVVINHPQSRVKDSYASSPTIGLTLRANGEEAVKVMDSSGNFVFAGIRSPVNAPSMADGAALPGTDFPTNIWVAYAYVYAAQKHYPLVENAITGGGSLAPRSNPSPSDVFKTNATTTRVVVTCKQSDRADIDRIWIYRSEGYATRAEAVNAGNAGLMFYVGRITNDPSLGEVNVTFSDTTVGLGEQVEEDNYVAPTFQFAVYADPYFYGFGNFAMIANVTITEAGIMTLTSPSDKWFNGRNGQIVTLEGVLTGGSDGFGSYYFKNTSRTQAQLYTDAALTNEGTLRYVGSTVATIRGPSTILYRSKPRNPFSWGFTEIIGDINVPQPYAYRVGGGQGTAIAVIPTANLLKLDTENPNHCYTFNLKFAGTPTFEDSRREISSSYAISNHWAQYTTALKGGFNVLWGIDYKYKSIIQSDGSTQVPISDAVFATMREVASDASSRFICHGIYDPRLEISCLWISTTQSPGSNDLMLFYHHPTETWGRMRCRDISCSALVVDSETSEVKVIVGTSTGFIGRAFAPDEYTHFCDGITEDLKVYAKREDAHTFTIQPPNPPTQYFHFPNTDVFRRMVGNWVLFVTVRPSNVAASLSHLANYPAVWGKIATIANLSGVGTQITFSEYVAFDASSSHTPPYVAGTGGNYSCFYIGVIPCMAGKFFNLKGNSAARAQDIISLGKVSEFWTTARGVEQDVSSPSVNTIAPTGQSIQLDRLSPYRKYPDPTYLNDPSRRYKLQIDTDGFETVDPTGEYYCRDLGIDNRRVDGIQLTDVGYGALTIFDFTIVYDNKP